MSTRRHGLWPDQGGAGEIPWSRRDTLHRFSRATAPDTQRRLRELLEILARVEPWAGGRLQALAWYRGRGIPALGDATAEALVRRDQAHVVRAWLDAYAAGAHA